MGVLLTLFPSNRDVAGAEKVPKGDKKAAAKEGAAAPPVAEVAKTLNLDAHAKAKGSITVDATDEATVQKFSSQRMRARLEARQRRYSSRAPTADMLSCCCSAAALPLLCHCRL